MLPSGTMRRRPVALPFGPVVIALLITWGAPVHAAIIALSLGLQGLAMRRLMTDPKKLAPWYNATGVTLYVLGMLTAAFALGSMGGGA